jgi:hypothetical protein
MKTNRERPAWPAPSKRTLLLVILVLASIEPLTHLWLHGYRDPAAAGTGIHTGDSAHHLLCMRAPETSFNSPFATCRSPLGIQDWRYFATPFFLFYAGIGGAAFLLNLNHFLVLGLLNGIGGALYLLAVWRFLCVALPRNAHRSMLLFMLGGGLGGILYIITGAAGLHGHPLFETYFQRYAFYDLIEGQHLAPSLLMPRFYYTFPLALGFAGLTCWIHYAQTLKNRYLLPAVLFMLPAAFLNMRIGPMFWCVGVLYLIWYWQADPDRRLLSPLTMGLTVFAGGIAAWLLMRQHPSYLENMNHIGSTMWFSPFISAVFFYLFLVPGECLRQIRGMRPVYRAAAGALAGYLGAWVLFYLAYQAYYGNLWRCLDATPPLRISDPALMGAALGAGLAFWREIRSRDDAPASRQEGNVFSGTPGWVIFWLLLFLALAISAFGHGFFLRFNPQRFMVMLGLPIAITAAFALERRHSRCPFLTRAFHGMILFAGICSTAVAALCFQGPLGHRPGEGPFAYLHYETMRPADERLIRQLGPGPVAVPPWSPIAFSEVLALNPGVYPLGGPGALNIGDQPFHTLQPEVNRFFAADTPMGERRRFAQKWCVRYVYCPDTCPVSEELLERFRKTPWLSLRAREGRGALFEVTLNAKAAPRPGRKVSLRGTNPPKREYHTAR